MAPRCPHCGSRDVVLRPTLDAKWKVVIEACSEITTLGPLADAAAVQRALIEGGVLLGIASADGLPVSS